METYKTVLISDEKGRVTIPSKVREMLNAQNIKVVFNFVYDPYTNELVLYPIGASDTK